MHLHTSKMIKLSALGVSAAVGLTGLLVAAPASAAPASDLAPVSGQAYAAQAASLLATDSIEAVGRNDSGDLVVVTTDENAKAVTDLTAAFGNVVVKSIDAPFSTFASTDVVAGAGYYAPTDPSNINGGGGLCSVGFSGWSPTGEPAIITAGHCTDDGALTDTYLTKPSLDTAHSGSSEKLGLTHPLGEFGFSQYGGPGNSAGEQNTDSVDVAVIDDINPDLTLKPEVTDWTTAGDDDLSKSTTEITAVGKPDASKSVEKSGRTTGHTTAPAGSIDIVDGWASVSGRLVYGFGVVGLTSDEGDSGGAIYQGTTAVGILSGGGTSGGESIVWGADLVNNLAHTDGYTVQLAIDAPVLTAPVDGGEVERNAAIAGTAPASSDVVVTPKGGESFTVKADGSGAWSFPAPNTLGAYEFSLKAKSGFNVSTSASYSVKVVAAPLAAPVVTTPADGADVTTEVTEVSGTAAAGAKVTVTGDVKGSAVADKAGNWKVAADLSYGTGYSISVVQALEGQTSPAAVSTFDVVPAAPVILAPVNGGTFAHDAAPVFASGTGIDGATVSATLNGVALPSTAEVVDGAWELKLLDSVDGVNSLVVTQTINGASASAQIAYTRDPAPVTVPTDPTQPTTPPTNPGTPGGGNGGGSGSGLANTGFETGAFGGIAALLLAAGLGTVVVAKRRRLGADS